MLSQTMCAPVTNNTLAGTQPILRRAEQASQGKSGEEAVKLGAILVADDEDFVRELVRAALGRRGYEVVAAKNGNEALEIVKSRPGSISVALVDFKLPDIEGLDLAGRIL